MTFQFVTAGRYRSTCGRFEIIDTSKGGSRRWLVYDTNNGATSIWPVTSKKLAIAKARGLAGELVSA